MPILASVLVAHGRKKSELIKKYEPFLPSVNKNDLEEFFSTALRTLKRLPSSDYNLFFPVLSRVLVNNFDRVELSNIIGFFDAELIKDLQSEILRKILEYKAIPPYKLQALKSNFPLGIIGVPSEILEALEMLN